MANTDPTFKTGLLSFYMVNNGLSDKVKFDKGQLTYPSEPARKWKEREDYSLTVAKEHEQKMSCCGYRLGYARERGPQAVRQGERFRFQFKPNQFRFVVEIVGVDGGSVLRPSIGLYNLVTKPNEWTYVSPERFSGEWGFQVVSTGWNLSTGVSVIYNPGQIGWSVIMVRFDNVLDFPLPWADGRAEAEWAEIAAGPLELLASRSQSGYLPADLHA